MPSAPPTLTEKTADRGKRSKPGIRPESDSKPQGKQEVKEKGKFAEKYKYVRFVEKKKVLRKMRQLQQSLMANAEADKVEIEKQLAELRKDLMYIDKFPGNQKYISLFPTTELSADCRKKQGEIRAMILNLTNRRDAGSNRKEKLDVITADDFFASVDNIQKPSVVEAPAAKPGSKLSAAKTTTKEKTVHPSWEAKKSNEKLTGSLTGQTFTGSRTVFGEDDE